MRIVIADDHPIYREAVRQQLSRDFPQAEILPATSVDQVLELLKERATDLVILDYSMPGTDGVQGLREIVAAAADLSVIVMSGVAVKEEVAACLDAGAKGFLPKTLDAPLLAAAVGIVLKGGTYMPVEFALKEMAAHPAAARDNDLPESLNDRDIAMLSMMVDGLSNKEIGRRLSLQESTVKYHFTRLFERLDARNRSQAAAKVVTSGILKR